MSIPSNPVSPRAAAALITSAVLSLVGLAFGLLAHATYQAHRPEYGHDFQCTPIPLPDGLTTYTWLAASFVLVGLLPLLWLAARPAWRAARPRRGAVPAAVALWLVALVGGVAPGWADVSYMHRMNAGMYRGSDLCAA